MKLLIEQNNNEKLSNVFDILYDVSNHEDVIENVRWSPNKNKIILDMSYNKALEIFLRDDKLIIRGDTNFGKYIQNILHKYDYK